MDNDSVYKDSIWFGSVKPQPHSSLGSTFSSLGSIPSSLRGVPTAAVERAGAGSSIELCIGSNVTADARCHCQGESDDLELPPVIGRAENKSEDAKRPCFLHLALSTFHREVRCQRREERARRGAATDDDDRTSIWFDSGKALPRTKSLSSRNLRVLQKENDESGAGARSVWLGSRIGRTAVEGSLSKRRCMSRRSASVGMGKCPCIGCRTKESFVGAVGQVLPHCAYASLKFGKAREKAPSEVEKLTEIDKIGEGNVQASDVEKKQDVGGFDGGVWEQFPPAPPDEVCRLELLSRVGKNICRLH